MDSTMALCEDRKSNILLAEEVHRVDFGERLVRGRKENASLGVLFRILNPLLLFLSRNVQGRIARLCRNRE